jgi:ABC-type phosphate transport system substrate-binding protein
MHRKSEFVCSKLLFICLVASATTTLLGALPIYAQTTSGSAYGPFPCVSSDQRANASANGFPVPSTCQQYFGVGAAFSATLVNAEANYYGVAIPPSSTQPSSFLNTGRQPIPYGDPGSLYRGFLASPSFDAVQYNYCPTNSRNGREVFLGLAGTPSNCQYTASTSGAIVTPNNAGTTALQTFPTSASTVSPLFASSNTPLSTGDLSTYASNKLVTRGNPIQVPVAFNEVAIVPNQAITSNGTVRLNLSTLDLCRVFDGTYTNYNQLQGTPGLPSTSLKVIIRSDDSGMTYVLTNYLAAICPSVTGGSYYLTAGTSIFPSVSQTANFQRVVGNDAVTNTIAATVGGLGYISRSGPPLPVAAALQNPVSGTYIGVVHTTLRGYLRNIGLASNSTYPCVLTLTGTTTIPTDGTAYPLASPIYALLYSKYATQEESDAARGLFNFMLLNTYSAFGPTSTNGTITVNDITAQSIPDYFLLRKSPGNVAISFPETNALRATARACVNSIIGP